MRTSIIACPWKSSPMEVFRIKETFNFLHSSTPLGISILFYPQNCFIVQKKRCESELKPFTGVLAIQLPPLCNITCSKKCTVRCKCEVIILIQLPYLHNITYITMHNTYKDSLNHFHRLFNYLYIKVCSVTKPFGI